MASELTIEEKGSSCFARCISDNDSAVPAAALSTFRTKRER